MRSETLLKYLIDYQGKKVWVELDSPPKRGVCQACSRKVGNGIKITQTHHFVYAYSKKRVVKEPELALENTVELCWSDHRLGNALMNLLSVKLENVGSIVKVAALMPQPMLLKMDRLCKLWNHYRRTPRASAVGVCQRDKEIII